MDAHQRRLRAFQIAAHKGNVLIVVHVAGVGDHAETAKARGQDRFRDAPDVALVLHAVANEVRHREHLQVVFLAKFNKLRHARHGAVITHDFADDARRSEAGDSGESTEASVWPARTSTPPLRARRGKCGRGARGPAASFLDRWPSEFVMARSEALIPVVDANARVHRFSEGRAVNGSVDGRHQREVEFVAALFREGMQIRPRPYLAMKLMASG